ncbi:MAG TPA: tetratricopeptide repeat protein [Anaerolineae bacterium]|nr:tetratricopeptide repeat protein [Anaerolineae bacterium]HQI83494.1 tetratricopeptide repeat protein [Anaerolineae bacterium]
MSPTQPSAADRKKAEALYQEALTAYERWDVELAVKKLESALALNPNNPSYHMNLAQILSRAGDFDRALRALANYLRLAPDSPVASRVEQLFASGMDPVEENLTDRMTAAQMPIDMIGAAIQMWMEFRIALGEEPLSIPKPEAWAAALDYTVRKVNLRDVPLDKLASFYDVTADTVRKHNATLVKMLDIMPCDYRYFTGTQNPLDKLVEAAELLEELENRFNED